MPLPRIARSRATRVRLRAGVRRHSERPRQGRRRGRVQDVAEL